MTEISIREINNGQEEVTRIDVSRLKDKIKRCKANPNDQKCRSELKEIGVDV